MADVENRRKDDSLVSLGCGCGWLYFPKTVCGQPKKKEREKNTYSVVFDLFQSGGRSVQSSYART